MAEREREREREKEKERERSKPAYIDLLYKGITMQCYNHFRCLYAYISKPQSVRKNTSGKDRCPYLCRIYLLTLLAYICKRCGARSGCSLRSSPTRTHNVRPKMARKTQQTQKADDLVVSEIRLRPDKHSAIAADSSKVIRSQWIWENLHNNTWCYKSLQISCSMLLYLGLVITAFITS